MRPGPAELSINTSAGVLPAAVHPASLPGGSTTDVTFHVPLSGEWMIAVEDVEQLSGAELNPNIGVCTMGFEIRGDGSTSMSCLSVP